VPAGAYPDRTLSYSLIATRRYHRSGDEIFLATTRPPFGGNSKMIRVEHVGPLVARDDIELAAGQARRYAKELMGAQSASAVFNVLVALSRIEKEQRWDGQRPAVRVRRGIQRPAEG
jgi:hypothetical protein